MFRIEATPNVQLITAWISHHLSLKIQVPVYRVITQKGMWSDAKEMSVNAKLWMNTFVKFLSLESLWTT